MFAKTICSIKLFPAEKRYKYDAVAIGYSIHPYSYWDSPTYHYRYIPVFDGTYRNIIVCFKNNFRLKINLKEESALYKKLMYTT